MAESRLDNARRNMTSSVISRVINLIIPFVVRAIMLYTIGVEYLGLNGLFDSVFSFLCIADLGINSAIVYMMYKPIAQGDTDSVCALLRVCRNFYRVTGVAVFVLGAALIPVLPKLIYGEVPEGIHLTTVYLILLANTSAGYFFFSYRETLFRASQRIDIITYVELVVRILTNGAVIVVLLVTRNYYLRCVVILVMTVVRNLTVAYLSRIKYPQYVCRGSITGEEKEQLRKQMSGLVVSSISSRLSFDLDNIVISSLLGLTLLAKYQNYQLISARMLEIVGLISASVLPGIGHSLVTESKEKNYNDMNRYQLLYMWLNGWLAICMVCLFQPFMTFWLGRDMLLPDSLLPFFGLYYISLKMDDVCWQYRSASGLFWEDRKRALFAAVFNLTMDILLVRWLGVAGAMVTTILYQVFVDSIWGDRILFKYTFKEFNRWDYMKKRIYYMVVITFAGVLCWLAGRFIPVIDGRGINAVLLLLARGLMCTLLSNAFMWLFFRRMPEYCGAVSLMSRLLHLNRTAE